MNIKKNTLGKIDNYWGELKSRVLFVLGAILIFRIGTFVPIPGINIYLLSNMLSFKNNIFINMFNMFSGGSLYHASVFTLGIMPYISASIIMQLLIIISSYFKELKKDGVVGDLLINQYTRYLTLLISIIQSFLMLLTFIHFNKSQFIFLNVSLSFYLIFIFSLTTGTMFLMWLGEQITSRGIGNGSSIIIFIGIISNLYGSLLNLIKNFVFINIFSVLKLFFLIFIVLLVILFIVFVEIAQRKILVQYAIRGNISSFNTYSKIQNTYLPIKINISGVIPAIFSSSLIMLLSLFIEWFLKFVNIGLYYYLINFVFLVKLFKIIFYSLLIMFFSFFYTFLIFNPKETSDNLKKSGAYIPGIRPGNYTKIYINKVLFRLTLFGSIYICIICLLPEFMYEVFGVSFYFGGTSLLIVVVVIIDFISQIQTLILSGRYFSMLKKSNLF